MSNDWFRSWHGAPTDNKWLVIGRRAGVAPGIVSAVVWALFDFASQNEDRGSVAAFDIETYSAFSGFDEAEVAAVFAALKEKGVIGPDGGLSSWNKRQPKREDNNSAERVRAFRAKQNANERNETQCNAAKLTETLDKTREDTDTERKKEGIEADASPGNIITLPDPRADLFDRGKRTLIALTGKQTDQCGKLIGRWLKTANDDAVKVLRAIEDAARNRVADAVPWIEAALRAPKPEAQTKPDWVLHREKMQRWV